MTWLPCRAWGMQTMSSCECLVHVYVCETSQTYEQLRKSSLREPPKPDFLCAHTIAALNMFMRLTMCLQGSCSRSEMLLNTHCRRTLNNTKEATRRNTTHTHAHKRTHTHIHTHTRTYTHKEHTHTHVRKPPSNTHKHMHIQPPSLEAHQAMHRWRWKLWVLKWRLTFFCAMPPHSILDTGATEEMLATHVRTPGRFRTRPHDKTCTHVVCFTTTDPHIPLTLP